MVHQPHIRCETLMDSTVARNHWNQQQLTWRIRVAQWPFSPTTNRPLSTTHRGTDVCPHYAILSPLLGFDYDGCRGPIRGSGVYETHLRQHRSSHLGKMMGWMFSQKARLESLGIPGVANKHYKYYKSWDLTAHLHAHTSHLLVAICSTSKYWNWLGSAQLIVHNQPTRSYIQNFMLVSPQ